MIIHAFILLIFLDIIHGKLNDLHKYKTYKNHTSRKLSAVSEKAYKGTQVIIVNQIFNCLVISKWYVG